MGEVKDNLTPTDSDDEKEKEEEGFLDKLLSKRNKRKQDDKPKDVNRNFYDNIVEADDALDRMIDIKYSDLQKEKGWQSENNAKLHCLRSMRFHLDGIVTAMEEYHKIGK